MRFPSFPGGWSLQTLRNVRTAQGCLPARVSHFSEDDFCPRENRPRHSACVNKEDCHPLLAPGPAPDFLSANKEDCQLLWGRREAPPHLWVGSAGQGSGFYDFRTPTPVLSLLFVFFIPKKHFFPERILGGAKRRPTCGWSL